MFVMAAEEEMQKKLSQMNLNQQENDVSLSKETLDFQFCINGEHLDLITEDKATLKKKQQRVLISSEPTTSHLNNDSKENIQSRYSTFIDGIDQFDPYQELTSRQLEAFRQVFDMVDKDGGGSIDADELYNSIKDLEFNMNQEEINEILYELDRDGNGEIDFEEFLYMMTTMRNKVETKQKRNSLKESERRQSMFLSVINKIAMKASIKEIQRYYANKPRHAPHVVNHYADGARVFGLSDKALRRTWKDFTLASEGKKSPYAQPLDFCMNFGNNLRKKGLEVRRYGNPINKSPSIRYIKSSSLSRRTSCGSEKNYTSPRSLSRGSSRPESKAGWIPRHRLPVTKVSLPSINHNYKRNLTIIDVRNIREKVRKACEEYYNRLHQENEGKALDYWKSLKVDEIPSERLQKNFTEVFRAYSPTDCDDDLPFSPRRCKKTKWKNFNTTYKMSCLA